MGEIAVGLDRWHISNLSDATSMSVTDVDEVGAPTVVWPGETVPLDHDMAIVEPLGGGSGALSVTVFFSLAPAGRRTTAGACPAITRRTDPQLDPDARYFAVLAALCGPVLFGGPDEPLPTSAQIAARLGLSPRAVDAHIDYLVEKFGIPTPVARGAGWKRRALLAHVRTREGIVGALRTARHRPPVTGSDRNRRGRLCRIPI